MYGREMPSLPPQSLGGGGCEKPLKKTLEKGEETALIPNLNGCDQGLDSSTFALIATCGTWQHHQILRLFAAPDWRFHHIRRIQGRRCQPNTFQPHGERWIA